MKYLGIIIGIILPSLCWASDNYLELKEGCYKSASYNDIMPINADNYKEWDKVTCYGPHHIEVFHTQRLARRTLDESTVSNVCFSAYQKLFKKSPTLAQPRSFLRWYWPDVDEYKKYGSTIICYLHAGDSGKYIALKNKPDELFLGLFEKVLAGLNKNNSNNSAVIKENLASETFRILPYNNDFLVFAQLYRINVDQLMYIVGLYKLSDSSIVALHNELINEEVTFVAKSNSISIDTAPYKLNSNTRAFGVRINSAHRSWPGWGGDINNRLMLYIERDGKILNLLNMYTTNESWKGMRIPGKNAEISLSTQDSMTNGFKNILLTAEITSWSQVLTRAGYYDVEYKKTNERTVLRFNGLKYISAESPPWWLFIEE